VVPVLEELCSTEEVEGAIADPEQFLRVSATAKKLAIMKKLNSGVALEMEAAKATDEESPANEQPSFKAKNTSTPSALLGKGGTRVVI
jgi:hypothetical protein